MPRRLRRRSWRSKKWKGGGRGSVRVGAGPTFSSYMLPALVKKFRRRFPLVDVYIETGDSAHLISRLRAGALDLIFDLAAADPDDQNLEQVAQWEAQTGFISSRPDVPSHCRLGELEKVPFILFAKGTTMESAIRHYFQSLNFHPSVVMRSDSAEAIKAMIRAGLGVSVLLLWNIDSEARSSAFTVIRTNAPPLSLRMALVQRRSGFTPEAVQELEEPASDQDVALSQAAMGGMHRHSRKRRWRRPLWGRQFWRQPAFQQALRESMESRLKGRLPPKLSAPQSPIWFSSLSVRRGAHPNTSVDAAGRGRAPQSQECRLR